MTINNNKHNIQQGVTQSFTLQVEKLTKIEFEARLFERVHGTCSNKQPQQNAIAC